MTSTLPQLPAAPAAFPVVAASLNATVAELLPSVVPAGPLPDFALEFATLIPAPTPAAAPAVPGLPAGNAASPEAASILRFPICPPAAKTARATLSPMAEAAAPLDAVLPAGESIEAGSPSRQQVEEAMTLVLPMLQTIVAGLALPLERQAAMPATADTGAGANVAGPVFPSAGLPHATTWAAGPGQPLPPRGLGDQPAAVQKPLAGGETACAVEGVARPVHVVAATLSADGAIELRLALPGAEPPRGDTLPAPEPGTERMSAIAGEVQLGEETRVRFEVVGERQKAPENDAPLARANFAALKPAENPPLEVADAASERNFLITGAKQVKLRSPDAGIAVAQPDDMLAAPIEEVRPTRNPELSVLPTRADFQVAPMPAERITVPAASPAGQNFAERAVETVTNLVEAQFSASMQKSATVQLRLKFGTDDLSVRVALRDGVVHTDFRTDSAELRAALTHEWQALAAQSPEQMHRYLDPVFAPAGSSPAPATTRAGAETSGQHPSQQDLPQRAPRDTFADSSSPFARRSLVSESFVPEPAAPRAPALLPTSLRLSVLA